MDAAYDLFVSHASEDKEEFVRPLVRRLVQNGLRVWFDEFTLRLGDSLRASIEHGLAYSRYGVVVLSPSFFAKQWPQSELNGLFAREMSGGKVILPIWHGVSREDVLRNAPILADKLAVRSEEGLDNVVRQIIEVVQEPNNKATHGPISAGRKLPFDKEHFRIRSQESIETAFDINAAKAGREARAHPGAVAKGNALLVQYQADEVDDAGLAVWLTIENVSQTGTRWFGVKVFALVNGAYQEIGPDPTPEGYSRLEHLFPGEQITVCYRFSGLRGGKSLTCQSWDDPLTFFWYLGA